MTLSEERQNQIEAIHIAANPTMSTISEVCRVMDHRKKYADFYLNSPNVDKEATSAAINQCNSLIKQLLGL